MRKAAFAIKNSTTIILPQWFSILNELKLDERMMPRDVMTCWNSTYDMLKFALDYRLAFDEISDQSLSLRPYELSKVEWRVVEDLCEVLKVRNIFSSYLY